MANNLRAFFQDIAEGIELGELNMEDIPEVELPENFNTEFHSKYLTEMSAKNNPKLMGHFKGKYLSSNDISLKRGFIAAGGTDEQFEELKKQEPDSLKLVDLVFNKVNELKIQEKPIKDDKSLEKLKLESQKEIENLKKILEDKDNDFNSKLSERDTLWRNKFVNEKIAAKLNSKTYTNGMDKDDAIYLTMKKLEDSPYLITLDEDLKFKILDKNEPETIAIKDGKALDIDSVLDDYSRTYTQKNDQTEKPPVRQVTVNADEKSLDGRYIPGHKDYGKV